MRSLGGITAIMLLGGIVALAAQEWSGRTQADMATVSQTPDASDYLSMRPEVDALPSQSLSATETAGLLYMREEEKLARDVYLTLYQKWDLPVFSNIAQSEQTHTESVRTLLEKYGIQDPVTDDTIGVFKDQTLAGLYTQLVAQGNASLNDALTVGATIEDLDIKDLQDRLAQTDNSDITLVYENLMKGSRNHLRSFVSQLQSRGGSYQPLYISQSEYDSIISSPRETGQAGSGAGRGWGGGWR